MMKFVGFSALNKKLLLNFVLFNMLALSVQNAYSSCYVNESWRPPNIHINLGRVIVKPDSEVGAVLAEGQYNVGGSRPMGSCDLWSGGRYTAALVNNKEPAGVDDTYRTNIKGIGIRVYDLIGGIKTYYPYVDRFKVGDGWIVYLNPARHGIEIIKTEQEVGTGGLTSNRLTHIYSDGSGPNRPAMTSSFDGDAVTIVNASCKVESGSQEKMVNLGSVSAGEFKDIRSTARETPFNINLQCVSSDQVTVRLRFDYHPDSSGVTGAIESQPGDNAATGVAVQLLTNEDMPIGNQKRVEAGKISPTDSRLTVPLKARFIRTAGNITAGSIQATATFTIEYK